MSAHVLLNLLNDRYIARLTEHYFAFVQQVL